MHPCSAALPTAIRGPVANGAAPIPPVVSACCFRDTDFAGIDGPRGGLFADAATLADAMVMAGPGSRDGRYAVVTRG